MDTMKNAEVGCGRYWNENGMEWYGEVIEIIDEDYLIIELSNDLKSDWDRYSESLYKSDAVKKKMFKVYCD